MQNNQQDSGSFGWAVLGFFFPLIGLILFLVWKSTKPLSAKKAGIGALIGAIVLVVVYIIVFVAMGAVFSQMAAYY